MALTEWSQREARPEKNAAGLAIMSFLKAQGYEVGEFPERYEVMVA